MASKLIYDNAFFRSLMAVSGKLFLKLLGWKVVGTVPDQKKFVAIAAPHTSNWDFPLFMAVVGCFNLHIRFLGKHTLFQGASGKLFSYLGGIPVDRTSDEAGALVGQAVEAFNQSEHMILGIAPEGTRTAVSKWKTGFYRIAVQAEVPILLAFVDRRTKQIGLGPLFMPTGDKEADLAAIQAFYTGKTGVKAL
ncbi:lysophospholipid acyltransferase family protein [Kordiimonas pumila]|uniref:Lysophospholipid acyltransferase family protein n=1 Tax=Kordiimonas pumila TaxID=2161677 RepID=A0ABV7D103_9PROT|nr:lysophospholipid acyltransferase family protein [Kordiimonas pumila]